MRDCIEDILKPFVATVLFTAICIGAALALAYITTPSAHASPQRLKAIKQVEGLHEVKHRKQIKRLIGLDPRIPWCGAATAYAVKKAGGKPIKYPNKAVNWTKFGKKVSLSTARQGDVVVLRFKRGYHVGIYSKRVGKGRIEVCGGNMSNRFKCSNYRTSSVRAVRR